jgi:hypothetical protein
MEETTLKDRVDFIEEAINNNPKILKRVKLRAKAKVGKSKLRKGWVGIFKIGENRNISLEKVKIEDSVFKLKNGVYHSSNGSEILWYDGKFPVLFQPETKINPIDFIKGENETYGQKYVMATMLKDSIKVKGKGMGGLIWVVIIGAVIFGGLKLFKII